MHTRLTNNLEHEVIQVLRENYKTLKNAVQEAMRDDNLHKR